MGSTNEIGDQPRVDSFFARQRDADYPGNKLSAIETFRDGQAGAFAIMNVLAHGRCLKSCLQSDVSSASWIKALEVIDHLTKLPWWIRVWVLQEAILPQNAVIAIYGGDSGPNPACWGFRVHSSTPLRERRMLQSVLELPSTRPEGYVRSVRQANDSNRRHPRLSEPNS
jgi:hypothetical protein